MNAVRSKHLNRFPWSAAGGASRAVAVLLVPVGCSGWLCRGGIAAAGN